MKVYFHAVSLLYVLRALEDRHISKVRWVEHSDGSVHGVAEPLGWHVKQTFGATDGITLFPAPGAPTPLSDHHVSKLARFGVSKGDTMHTATQKMMAVHPEVPAFDPDLPFPPHSF